MQILFPILLAYNLYQHVKQNKTMFILLSKYLSNWKLSFEMNWGIQFRVQLQIFTYPVLYKYFIKCHFQAQRLLTAYQYSISCLIGYSLNIYYTKMMNRYLIQGECNQTEATPDY